MESVFVLNVVDGCIPSDLGTGTAEELKEERRLLYVAMTRAKDDLHLIIPQRFFVHGQSTHRGHISFLKCFCRYLDARGGHSLRKLHNVL
jgi:superfamily I DNA/RNA helicase